MPTCSNMLSAIAATKNIFFHRGRTRRLAFSEREFIALNISTTTRIDKLMVVADFAILSLNIAQPISGKRDAQLWKWVCKTLTHVLLEGVIKRTS